MVILSSLPVPAQAAYGNNDNGEIVGVGVAAVGSRTVGVYWASEDAAPQALPPLQGDDIGSFPLAINNEGVICGSSVHQDFQGADTFLCHRAVVWRVSSSGDVCAPIELSPAQSHELASAAAVSDHDTITGCAKVVGWSSQEPDGIPSAVAWTVQWDEGETPAFVDSHARVLSDGAIGEASGVNHAGMICGWVESGWGVVWTNESTPTTVAYNKYVAGKPRDINKHGMSVGWGWYHKMWVSGPCALMWSSPTSSLIMLDQFLDDHSPYGCLTDAHAVNDSGQIVGTGWDGSVYTAFVAVPK